MYRTKSSERGQALVIVALAIVGLIALTALTVDGGNVYSDRRHAQNAADTAVLATALSMVRNNNWSTAQAAGLARAASNGYSDTDASNASSSTTANVEIYNPPISGSYVGDSEYVQVIITSVVSTYFAPIVGITELTNRVDAVARIEPTTTAPLFEGNAVVGLSPHDCQAVKYQGNANTTLKGGGIFVNSNCDDSAFFNNSSSAQLTAPHMCSVGGITYKPGAINIPQIQTGSSNCEPEGYPPASLVLPNITCSSAAVKSGNVLSQGWYVGTFPPAGVEVLESGVYCVDGNFRLNAGDILVGSNVTISVETGDIRWSGGAEIVLTAPKSGPYKGLLISMPLTNLNEVIINGNSGSQFGGTFLVPGANVTVNGTGGSTGTMSSQIVGYTVDLSGTAATQITYDADDLWKGGVPPKLEFSK